MRSAESKHLRSLSSLRCIFPSVQTYFSTPSPPPPAGSRKPQRLSRDRVSCLYAVNENQRFADVLLIEAHQSVRLDLSKKVVAVDKSDGGLEGLVK